jgi:hypothetical protein
MTETEISDIFFFLSLLFYYCTVYCTVCELGLHYNFRHKEKLRPFSILIIKCRKFCGIKLFIKEMRIIDLKYSPSEAVWLKDLPKPPLLEMSNEQVQKAP